MEDVASARILKSTCVDEELDVSEVLDQCGDELAVVVDADWTNRIVNPRALSPTVGAKCRGMNRR